MLPWKKNLTGRQKKDPEPRSDIYSVIKKEVQPLRKQGEPPVRDAASFSRYVCDLCNTVHPVQGLRQCAVCGRWACADCWTKEYYLCNSCNGIVRLHQVKTEHP